MADTKITALTALTAADPANDVLPIVDVSDTTMAASGTTKKISVNNILGASGTATLASATITGDLTVATNKLKVTGGNVGIGTASPNNYANYTTLTINGTSGGEIDLTDGGTLRGQLFSESTGLTLAAVGGFIKFGAGAGGLEQMRLNSTGLGVGASPQVKLTVRTPHAVATATTYTGGLLIHDEANGIAPHLGAGIAYNGGDQISWIQSNSSSGVYPLALNPAGGEVRIGGNVGIGVTPSAWAAGYKAIQISSNQSTALMGSGNQTELTTNAFFDGAWKYQGAGTVAASRYSQQSGVHYWYTAAAGAAGTAIGSGFTNAAMTLDASGNLILLSSNTPATLTTNGQLTVNATSNTNLRFSYRGSDGVTRVANITLA